MIHADKQRVDELNGLSEAAVEGIEAAMIECRTHTTPHYTLKYGPRRDFGDMAFHFFAPEGGWGDHGDIRARIEHVLATAGYDEGNIHAEFVPELDSYCLFVAQLGSRPDPFFDADRRIIAALDHVQRGPFGRA